MATESALLFAPKHPQEENFLDFNNLLKMHKLKDSLSHFGQQLQTSPHSQAHSGLTIVVVLQGLQNVGRGVACSQLGQSAAGGAQLRPQVGHLLAGRLNGPIDALGQLLVVIHHSQDFCLTKREESRQGVMLSS